MQKCESELIPHLQFVKAESEASPFLKVEALGFKRASRWIFESINFEAKAGSVVVLSGPSGAGKSSLLSILAGEWHASTGHISFEGLNSQAQIGTIYQDLRLSEELSVLDNILSGQLFRLRWWNFFFGFSKKAQEEAIEIAREFEIDSLLYKPVKFLSGGERQRVAIAKLLFQKPKVILADEPVSSLDPRLAAKVLNRLKWEARENSRIVICALHQRDLNLDFADRIIEFC